MKKPECMDELECKFMSKPLTNYTARPCVNSVISVGVHIIYMMFVYYMYTM